MITQQPAASSQRSAILSTQHSCRPEGTRSTRDCVVVVDFGSQTAQLIVRRVRELNVYSELVPHDAPWERVAALSPKGIILSGGPKSVYAPGAPQRPSGLLEQDLPILGICYGMQALFHVLGGDVRREGYPEY
ncbi:MAG: glutamine amidotransferase-related protein, partial [Thermomicrobiales bacterium]